MTEIAIPIAVSARHAHLSRREVEILFGKKSLTRYAELNQPGYFAAEEVVEIIGPKGSLNRVRCMEELRNEIQIEISATDARTIGATGVEIRDSGSILSGPTITIRGPAGELQTSKVMIARRHVHMDPKQANELNIQNGDFISVIVDGDRSLIFNQTKIRVASGMLLEMHIDTDEANAAGLFNGHGRGRLLAIESQQL